MLFSIGNYVDPANSATNTNYFFDISSLNELFKIQIYSETWHSETRPYLPPCTQGPGQPTCRREPLCRRRDRGSTGSGWPLRSNSSRTCHTSPRQGRCRRASGSWGCWLAALHREQGSVWSSITVIYRERVLFDTLFFWGNLVPTAGPSRRAVKNYNS